jgi:hypothetical protein
MTRQLHLSTNEVNKDLSFKAIYLKVQDLEYNKWTVHSFVYQNIVIMEVSFGFVLSLSIVVNQSLSYNRMTLGVLRVVNDNLIT